MRLRQKSGQALLLVMWAMFIMSFSILGLVQLLNINISGASAMERVAIASSLAFAGITMGRNPEFPVNGQTEKQTFPNGSKLEVVVISENSKLQINKLLEGGDRDTLRALFRIWGLNDVEADTVLDCLFDYVEPGTARRLNGAKAEQYRLAHRPPPPGRPFRSIEEMNSVLHFDLLSSRKENWRDYFTIYGDGTLDLTQAPLDLIKAVCRVSDSGARAVRQTGAEGKPAITSLDAARVAMGLTEKEFKGIRKRITLEGRTRRIRATATLGTAGRTIETICRITPDQSSILEWREW